MLVDTLKVNISGQNTPDVLLGLDAVQLDLLCSALEDVDPARIEHWEKARLPEVLRDLRKSRNMVAAIKKEK